VEENKVIANQARRTDPKTLCDIPWFPLGERRSWRDRVGSQVAALPT
jgi:hypothetical protein